MFAAKSTGGFYDPKVNVHIPSDAVEITKALHSEILEGMSAGKVIGWDAQGFPVLLDPPPLTEVEMATAERIWRDSELAACQWVRDRHRDEHELGIATTLTGEQFIELLSYLQALRDWPQSEPFPDAQKRPVAPSWVAEQL